MLKKGIFFIITFVAAFVLISLISFNPADSKLIVSNVNLVKSNWFGEPGVFFSSHVFILFGRGSYFFILFFVLIYFSYFTKIFSDNKIKRFLGILLGIFTVSYSILIITDDQSFNGGGIFAGIIYSVILKGFGFVGGILLLIFLTISSVLLACNIPFNKLIILLIKGRYLINDIKSSLNRKSNEVNIKPPLFQKKSMFLYTKENNSINSINIPADSSFKNDAHINVDEIDENIEIENKKVVPYDVSLKNTGESLVQKTEEQDVLEDIISNDIRSLPMDDDIDEIKSIINWSEDDFEDIKSIEDFVDRAIEIETYEYDGERIAQSYNNIDQATKTIIDREYEELTEAETKDESVNIDLEKTNDIKSNEVENNENVNTELTDNNSFETLQNGSNNYKNINHELISIGFNVLQTTNIDSNIVQTDELETSKKLEETLMEFNIEARVNHVARGPVITRYEVLLAPGIKVSRIVSLQDNIALSLAASKIRVVAPIPGKSAVGIEIPNKHRTSVTLGDLLNCSEYKKHNYHLPIALGKGISGRTIIADLVTMPHLLIAGATGSGKSVFVNTLICSLLYSKTPSEARFIMIDPKRVELKMYNEIPNLIAPVITEPKKAVASLKWTVKEMERRYKLLERYNCRDIRSFNNKISLMKSKDPHYLVDLPLEYLIVIIDEFADLMMVCGKDAEEQVSRLAAMSRAVGIHLVVATQRPSVDVITGIIKANFPARIAFQVSSKTESRIILDTNGAEKLLGKGDLLFSSPGLGNPIRIQGAFLSDDEVSDITGHLKSISPPSYIDELESIETSDGDQSNYTIADEPLFREAVEIVLADRKVSASYLQRKMRIGYNRAARIVELMEEEGIITPANGSKPREILIENYQF